MSNYSQYVEGYQAGMQDIADALERGGISEVRAWLSNNHLAAAQTREQLEWIAEITMTTTDPKLFAAPVSKPPCHCMTCRP